MTVLWVYKYIILYNDIIQLIVLSERWAHFRGEDLKEILPKGSLYQLLILCSQFFWQNLHKTPSSQLECKNQNIGIKIKMYRETIFPNVCVNLSIFSLLKTVIIYIMWSCSVFLFSLEFVWTSHKEKWWGRLEGNYQ